MEENGTYPSGMGENRPAPLSMLIGGPLIESVPPACGIVETGGVGAGAGAGWVMPP